MVFVDIKHHVYLLNLPNVIIYKHTHTQTLLACVCTHTPHTTNMIYAHTQIHKSICNYADDLTFHLCASPTWCPSCWHPCPLCTSAKSCCLMASHHSSLHSKHSFQKQNFTKRKELTEFNILSTAQGHVRMAARKEERKNETPKEGLEKRSRPVLGVRWRQWQKQTQNNDRGKQTGRDKTHHVQYSLSKKLCQCPLVQI